MMTRDEMIRTVMAARTEHMIGDAQEADRLLASVMVALADEPALASPVGTREGEPTHEWCPKCEGVGRLGKTMALRRDNGERHCPRCHVRLTAGWLVEWQAAASPVGGEAGTLTREAIETVRAAMDAAWQDIQDWTTTARGLRARSAKPDHDNVPHERGIRESEQVIAQMAPAFRILDAALAASPAPAPEPLVAQRDRLQAALMRLVGVSTRTELEQMEVVMRSLPGITEDKSAALDAIHALLAFPLPEEPSR